MDRSRRAYARRKTRYTLERSDDDGASWTLYWEMEYAASGSGFSLPQAPPVAAGCQAPEYAEFDFWHGDWSAGGAATNDLRKQLGGCILEENWRSAETARASTCTTTVPSAGRRLGGTTAATRSSSTAASTATACS